MEPVNDQQYSSLSPRQKAAQAPKRKYRNMVRDDKGN